jgi:hypothetical protein
MFAHLVEGMLLWARTLNAECREIKALHRQLTIAAGRFFSTDH